MITDDDVIELLSALVRIPSVNPAFRQPNDPPEWFGEAAVGHGSPVGWPAWAWNRSWTRSCPAAPT
jgi:acetylornithine deacetylase/succinyl-diaminopimelate desuccinylase-like protein